MMEIINEKLEETLNYERMNVQILDFLNVSGSKRSSIVWSHMERRRIHEEKKMNQDIDNRLVNVLLFLFSEKKFKLGNFEDDSSD